MRSVAPVVERDPARGLDEEGGERGADVGVPVARPRRLGGEVRRPVVVASRHEVALEERAERDRRVALRVEVVPDRPPVADRGGVRQQVPDRDRSMWVARRPHRERQDLVHVVVESEVPVLDRLQHRGADHGLGDRGEHEQGLLADGLVAPDVGEPEAARPSDGSVPHDGRADAGEPTGAHPVGDEGVEIAACRRDDRGRGPGEGRERPQGGGRGRHRARAQQLPARDRHRASAEVPRHVRPIVGEHGSAGGFAVGRAGFEPATRGLKAPCSNRAELPARGHPSGPRSRDRPGAAWMDRDPRTGGDPPCASPGQRSHSSWPPRSSAPRCWERRRSPTTGATAAAAPTRRSP